MRKLFLGLIIFSVGVLFFYTVLRTYFIHNNPKGIDLINLSKEVVKSLDKYTIENLAVVEINAGNIEIKDIISEEEDFTSYIFILEFNPNLDGKTLKITTGQLNIPSGSGVEKFPLVVMLRGYIDQESYQTGDGTRRASEVFAKNGFLTIAPDFLGHADSDPEAGNIFEARFQTYTTVLSLLKSLDQLQSWDGKNIFIWGHSNGGQIALTVLEISGKNYPSTLWAPVSKPFPYSILFYTDVSEDRGKLIRRELAQFEKTYDPDKYSLDLYLNKINAPLVIHQGTNDSAVPLSWSNELSVNLDYKSVKHTYYKYPGANHNMIPFWDTIVSRDLDFFNQHIISN